MTRTATESTGDGPESWTGGEDESGEIMIATYDGGACIGNLQQYFQILLYSRQIIYTGILGTYPAVFTK